MRIAVFQIVTLSLCSCAPSKLIIERNVEIKMRDGVVLRADVFRPAKDTTAPVLVYRTPYNKQDAADEYATHLRAVERGYAVVIQDVRGRYASDGFFNPYRNEGQDGYDTIEWAAAQPWSNGQVGTYGLSYPGAVQWLAAVESPPHLKAMAPAMTFSTPRNFFYMNGVFDLSWLPWIYSNIAPDARLRLGIEGAKTRTEVAEGWAQDGDEMLNFLPLSKLPQLRDEAKFYFEWLQHPPEDSWWNWAEIRGRYDATDAAVLNLSGWYDEAYGPEGAVTNFGGLVESRGKSRANTQLILGPWQHGVNNTAKQVLGELDFGPQSKINYDEELLTFFDKHLKSSAVETDEGPSVRYFVMGANEWRTDEVWPPSAVQTSQLCLAGTDANGSIGECDTESELAKTTFLANPKNPVMDPYGTFEAHDFQQLAIRDDVLIFETSPLSTAVTIAGNSSARLFVSCDCEDFDLWVRLLDVYPDGRAINLMSPGADVQRLSLREPEKGRQLLLPDTVYEVHIDGLLTSNRFDIGHRIRLQVSASFAPHLSRNLQTGLSEVDSKVSRKASITVHHSSQLPSSLVIPVIP